MTVHEDCGALKNADDQETLEKLILRSQAGDEAAYAAVVRRFQGMAFSYAYSILSDYDLAEDVRQESFLSAYVDLLSLREPAAFPGWFRQIVENRSISFKRGRRQLTVPLDLATEVACGKPGPRQAAQANETRAIVQRAVERLPEAEGDAVKLFYFEGRSLNEIGKIKGIDGRTVKSRLHSARIRLRQGLMEMAKDTALKQSNAGDRKLRKAAASEAIVQFEKELSCLLHTPSEEEQRKAGDLLCAKGRLHRLMGQMDSAMDCFQKGIAIPALWRDGYFRARFRAEMGLTYVQMSDYPKAEKQLEMSRVAAKDLDGEDPLLAVVLNGLGICAWGTGNLQKAEMLYRQTIRESERTRCGVLAAEGYNNLALVEWKRGHLPEALREFRSSLRLWKKVKNRFGWALSLMNMGIIEENMGRFAGADRHYREALEEAGELGYVQLRSACHCNLANLALVHGRWKQAAERSLQARDLAREAKDQRSEAVALENLGLAYVGLKRHEDASKALAESAGIAREIGDEERLFSLELAKSEQLLALRAARDAEVALVAAGVALRSNGFRSELPRLLRLRTRAEALLGREEEARATFKEAVQACREQKNLSELRRIRSLEKALASARRKREEGAA